MQRLQKKKEKNPLVSKGCCGSDETGSDLKVVELEGLCTAVVEVVSHIDSSAQQDQKQDHAHTQACLVGHMHLQNQSDKSINTIAVLQGRPYPGDMTH